MTSLVSIRTANTTSTFIYNGDGVRVKKSEGGQIILYINGYYEKNLTTGNVTTYYYLGDRLVAMRQSTTLTYIHQDHLTGTSVVSDSTGALVSSIKYYPFGECRNSQGNPGTDKLFTGQRLDGTGLYYYGARYYDPAIGRFISADIIVQKPGNPQSLNRYSYCVNNPLKYIDPSGHEVIFQYQEEIEGLLQSGLEIPQEWINVFCAAVNTWNTLKEYVPQLVMFEDSPTKFRVDLSNPELLTADAISLAADIASFVPSAMVIGWLISTISSGTGLALTGIDQFYGRATEEEYNIALFNFILGMAPWIGAIGSFNQLIYDLRLTGGPFTEGRWDIGRIVNETLQANMQAYEEYGRPWWLFPSWSYGY